MKILIVNNSFYRKILNFIFWKNALKKLFSTLYRSGKQFYGQNSNHFNFKSYRFFCTINIFYDIIYDNIYSYIIYSDYLQ